MMRFWQADDRRYAQFEVLADADGLVHAFSTRPQDVSARRDARQAERAAARATMARDLGLDPDRLSWCVQAHRDRIAVIESPQPAGELDGYDAVITNVPNQALMTFSADCPLVLLFDPRRRALGLVHSSWRCTVGQLVRRTVVQMCERFGARPRDLHCGIGPSAGPTEYEVGDDVLAAAADLPEPESLFPIAPDGRRCFDLWRANRLLLEATGIPAAQIHVAGVCTMTATDVFYSFRQEGVGCGHFGLMAALRD